MDTKLLFEALTDILEVEITQLQRFQIIQHVRKNETPGLFPVHLVQGTMLNALDYPVGSILVVGNRDGDNKL